MNKETIIKDKEKNPDKKKQEDNILLHKNEIKDMNNNNDKYIQVKDLIIKLLNTSFDSISTIELNTESQLNSLKDAENRLDNDLKILINIKKAVEENKKKEIEKQLKSFKQRRKLGTDTNILKFRTKNFRNMENKTISNFNTINNKKNEKEIEEKTKKLHFGKNTQQNFTMKNQEKEKNNIIMYDKDKTFTNKLFSYKTKTIINNKLSQKRGLSKSFTKNPISHNKKENETSFNKIKNDNKDIKGMLYKKNKNNIIKDSSLFTIDEKSSKNISKKNVATKENQIKNKKDNLKPEERIKIQEKEIEKLSEELKKYKKKVNLLEKDDRQGIFVLKQNKNVIISNNLIKISDEIIIEVKTEPLIYYDNYYYLLDYNSEQTKIKEVYIDNLKIDETKLEIINNSQINIQIEKTYNGQTRKIKEIQEIKNELVNYSYYPNKLEDKGALIQYIIKTVDDIQIDDVTNKYFKIDKGNNYACFEGKITNEISVNTGQVIYSKKIKYRIYEFIPEFKPKEKDIIKKKESNNLITINILSLYKKVSITDYGQDIEVIYKFKISNYLTETYSSLISYPLIKNQI